MDHEEFLWMEKMLTMLASNSNVILVKELTSSIMKIHNTHKVKQSKRAYKYVYEPRGSGNIFPLNYKFKM